MARVRQFARKAHVVVEDVSIPALFQPNYQLAMQIPLKIIQEYVLVSLEMVI